MKKVLFLLITFIVSLLSFSSTHAAPSAESIYYKTIAVTNTHLQVRFENDGEKVVKTLDTMFTKMRADKDKAQLKKIINRVEPILVNLQRKSSLNQNEKNLKLLADNIYARAKVLHDVLIK